MDEFIYFDNKLLTIRALCTELTLLDDGDIAVIERLAEQLPMMAELSRADVFIDCLSKDGGGAIVVAQSRPSAAPSLYARDIVGEAALEVNEPGVFQAFATGVPVTDARGVSQEGVPIRQNVVPVFGERGNVVAVLIQEQDMTEVVEQQISIEALERSNAYMTEMLLAESFTESDIPNLFEEAVVLLDNKDRIRYANEHGRRLIGCGSGKASWLYEGADCSELLLEGRVYTRRTIPLYRGDVRGGTVVLLRDRTEVKEKERQLLLGSVVIREIQHRIDNNLQTIASLMRLQQRRHADPSVREALDESLSRIEGMARIHRLLAESGGEKVAAAEALAGIGKEMLRAMAQPDQRIKLSWDVRPLELVSGQFSTLALIMNELLQNAVKHAALPGGHCAITVMLRPADGGEAHFVWEERLGAPTVTDKSAGNPIAAAFPADRTASADPTASTDAAVFAAPAVSAAPDGPTALTAPAVSGESGQLGLVIIRLLAEEKLRGRLRREAGSGYCTVTIHFPIEG
ncbi:sensor histidine kinase [Paenibacillus beijingensis]|uniref:histidine kinase n=1 Tax=Paenibacillus beijingensis TaxID=1126833 RepID=A0A0D5NJP2_9BACL|nr:sensor histidine kinase [Paenibacillus beijingensis]AJY75202.1 hypothetical protein VN24_12220 [Paenibacillus beijingensis]